MWLQYVYLEQKWENEVWNNQISAYWSKTPVWSQNDNWPRYHKGIPNPYRHECNQARYPTKDSNNIFKLPKSSLNKKNVKYLDPKHIHTLNKSNQFLYFKNKSRQFSEYTLIHVFLVMAKSHCTCTCIKSSKEYCVLCVKNIARLHTCLHVITIWDMRKIILTHTQS